jgi:hypothetical protein
MEDRRRRRLPDPDALTGKKSAKSLGRRSPETETAYREFLARRDAVKAEQTELEPRVEMAGRIAKALRLTRMPSDHAEGLRNIWKSGLFGDESPVLVSGSSAVLLYETMGRVLAPSSALKDEDGLVFILPGKDRLTWQRAMEFAIQFGGRDPQAETLDSDDFRWRMSVDGIVITLLDRDCVSVTLERLQAPPWVEECADECLRAEPASGFVFARDATVAPVLALDPRSFCLLAPLLAGDNEGRRRIAWNQVPTVEEIVRNHLAMEFTSKTEDALEERRRRADPDGDGPVMRL